MCQECYKAYGSPTINTAETRVAAKLLREMSEQLVQGIPYLMVHSWQLTDEAFAYCLADELTITERAALLALRHLSVPEQASALALSQGFWTPNAGLIDPMKGHPGGA